MTSHRYVDIFTKKLIAEVYNVDSKDAKTTVFKKELLFRSKLRR